jgi:DNA polymerase sigma
LCLPWSDIDIVLDIKYEKVQNQYEAFSAIEKALLASKEIFTEVKYISNTSFPVIKITCNSFYLNKKLDITLLDHKHTGLTCVDLVIEYLAQYEGILRPILFIIKQLLHMAGLNDPY